MTMKILPSSFRDPSGFVFRRDGVLYRQVNASYREHFDLLESSGLYEALVGERLTVPHERASLELRETDEAYAVIRPEPVWFISYPYEWSFGQLRDAALLTLRVQSMALARGMTLKDASAYNVQYDGCRPVFIDTLSFERYHEGRPWAAYGQFCQHFLAPLALMGRTDVRLGQLLRAFVDGIPLDLAAKLVPLGTRFNSGLLLHLHMHAKSQRRYAHAGGKAKAARVSRRSLEGILSSLESAVRGLQWEASGTTWADYYEETNYPPGAFEQKKELVSRFLERTDGEVVWDLGANTGVFSRLACDRRLRTVSLDFDPAAVERNYTEGKRRDDAYLVPVVMDLTNPSPGPGWDGRERDSLEERGPADVLLALALVHHLAIGNNVPLLRVAEFFARIGRWLVVEFVPKEDSQVRRLLAPREDVFRGYHASGFEAAFAERFAIVESAGIKGTERTLYLMRRKD